MDRTDSPLGSFHPAYPLLAPSFSPSFSLLFFLSINPPPSRSLAPIHTHINFFAVCIHTYVSCTYIRECVSLRFAPFFFISRASVYLSLSLIGLPRFTRLLYVHHPRVSFVLLSRSLSFDIARIALPRWASTSSSERERDGSLPKAE